MPIGKKKNKFLIKKSSAPYQMIIWLGADDCLICTR